MLLAVPKRWMSMHFWLREPRGGLVAELRLSWRERGAISVAGVTYRAHRKGFRREYVLEAPDGSLVASALRPRVLRRELIVDAGSTRYVLAAASWYGREHRVFEGERQIGSIVPASFLRRSAKVEFGEQIPAVHQSFLVWLTLLYELNME